MIPTTVERGTPVRMLILLLLSFQINVVLAQSAGIELDMGRGAYKMTDLTAYMQQYAKSAGLPFKQTDRFPDAVNYGGAFVVGVGKFETGVDYRFYRAKGALLHTENAEETGLDISARSHALGIFGKYPIVYSKFFQLKTGVNALLYSSKVHHQEYYSTPQVYNSLTMDLKSKSIVVGPFVEPVIYFTGGLYAGIRFGYAYDFQGELFPKENNKGKFVSSAGDPVKTDWTGLRSDLFIGLRLNP